MAHQAHRHQRPWLHSPIRQPEICVLRASVWPALRALLAGSSRHLSWRPLGRRRSRPAGQSLTPRAVRCLQGPLDEPLDKDGHRCQPKDGTEYIASKQERVMTLARQKRRETGATWCIVENGASGPTFAYDDLSAGFSAIFVSGPGVERGVLVRSAHANREENMWLFTRMALDLLADCVAEAEAAAAKAVDAPVSPPPAPVLAVVEDRYGGVEVSVREGAELETSQFVEELRAALEGWMADGKRGIWLKLPAECHRHISAAVTFGFAFHHATPEYLELTRWLPSTPSPSPRFVDSSRRSR